MSDNLVKPITRINRISAAIDTIFFEIAEIEQDERVPLIDRVTITQNRDALRRLNRAVYRAKDHLEHPAPDRRKERQ